MNKLFKLVVMTIVATSALLSSHAQAAPKKDFKVAVSIYVGWMPWYESYETKRLEAWGKKYGETIAVSYMSYPDSIDAYTSGQVDAVVITNMDLLTGPCVGGRESTAIIMGDFSNGNDAVLTRGDMSWKDLKGQDILLCQNTVSEYLLVRGLETNGMKESDVHIKNISDADIQGAFTTNKNQKVVVTWNPMVMGIKLIPDADVHERFTSAQVPGEILDLMVVGTKVLKENPDFGRVLNGNWYETLGIMSKRGSPEAAAAKKIMAKLSPCDVAEFDAQLKTTALFNEPKSAVEFTGSQQLKTTMDLVRKFCFEHKLLGENADSMDAIGIQFPDGSVAGNKANVKMHFDTTFMQEAADGKLVR